MNIEALRFALAEYERMLGCIPAMSDNTHDRFARRVYESLIQDAHRRLACLGWSEMGQEMTGQG